MVSTATAAELLDGEAFNQLVLEKGLTTWEQEGYVYAGFRGPNGYELFRTYGPKWRFLYQARRINTQDNVAGGALTTRITVAEGQVAEIVRVYMLGTASAGSTLTAYVYDEDNAMVGRLAVIGAGASTSAYLPSIGSAASSSSNLQQTLGMLLGPGEQLVINASAALQTEYLTVGVVMILSTDTEPTWATTGSAGTPNLAASTISTANTMQPVLMP